MKENPESNVEYNEDIGDLTSNEDEARDDENGQAQ